MSFFFKVYFNSGIWYRIISCFLYFCKYFILIRKVAQKYVIVSGLFLGF